MSEVIKLIRDTDRFFQYETSSTPTTEDELQAYLKNTHAVVENITDAVLWQPSTEYVLNQLLRSPNLPAGTFAKCTTAGTSGANEPAWSTSTTTFTDGSCKWTLVSILTNITATGDVTGSATVGNNGSVSISLALGNKVTAGTVGDTTNSTARSFTVPYFAVDAKGRVTSYGKRTITVANASNDSLAVTAGTHAALNPSMSAQFSTSEWITTFNVNKATVKAGTYSIKTLIQALLNMAHTHTSKRLSGSNCNCNCNCDCDCGDDSGP